MMDRSSQAASLQSPQSTAAELSKRGAVFYGWWTVLTAAVALFWGVPISVYSFSVFLKPLILEFHASRAAVSLAFTLRAISDAIVTPFVGLLIARFGTRRVVLPSALMFGFILVSMRFFSGGIGRFYIFYVAFALFGGIAFGPLAFGNVVSRWFDRRRGLALGLSMLGVGAGAIFIPPLAQRLIANFGWRNAYAILGLAVLLIPIPVVAALLREKPQDKGLLPDGIPSSANLAQENASASGALARDAWRSPAFWLMVCAFFLVGATVQGCVTHTAAILNDRGISLQLAALGTSLLGTAVVLSRIVTGYLLDRLFAPFVATVFFGLVAVGICLFLIGGVSALAFLGTFLIGLGLGAEIDIIPFMISRYFGLRAFAPIYSVALAAFILSGALGSLAMGWGFDATRSYRSPLIAFLVATLFAAVLINRLGPYRYRAATET